MDGLALVYLAAVIALASVTYRYVEVPGYDAAKRFVNRRSARCGNDRLISINESPLYCG